MTIYPADRFERDAKHDRLPTVSWIVPTSGQSEHPAYLPASGANCLASKLNAVAENRDLWAKTVFIVNYDENDGLFDHVVPPLPPAGAPAEFVDGLPIGGGVRVPCFLVSPWSVGGYVATEQFDHTSVLGFSNGRASTPDGKKAYVANTGPNTGPGGSESVSVIDVASQTVSGTVTLGEGPQMVTVSPDGSFVFALDPQDNAWVTCNTSSSLVVIDTSSNAVIKSIDIGLGDDPTGIAFA